MSKKSKNRLRDPAVCYNKGSRNLSFDFFDMYSLMEIHYYSRKLLLYLN